MTTPPTVSSGTAHVMSTRSKLGFGGGGAAEGAAFFAGPFFFLGCTRHRMRGVNCQFLLKVLGVESVTILSLRLGRPRHVPRCGLSRSVTQV